MDEADLVGVHEAGIAHHVAAVGEVDGQHRAAAVGHGRGAVVVQLLVVVGADVAAGEALFKMLEEGGSIDITSSKWPCLGQSLTIRILPSRSMIWALISPTFSLSRTSWGSLPSRICLRISGTHLGQSESVVRGQPRGGFSFC